MTTPQPSPREPAGPPADSTEPAERARRFALEYARHDVAGRKRTAEFIAGIVLSCGAVLGSVSGAMCAGGRRGIAIPLIVIAFLVIVAMKFREDPDRRGVCAAIWIGIAVGLLLEGMCWLVMLGPRIGG